MKQMRIETDKFRSAAGCTALEYTIILSLLCLGGLSATALLSQNAGETFEVAAYQLEAAGGGTIINDPE